MKDETIASLPAQPPGIAEWEDLLVRLEIMPRALRATLESVAAGGQVDRVIHEMIEREEKAGQWLENAATGEHPDGSGGRQGATIRNLVERFEALRLRNFAMVQRRGVDVWSWSATRPEGGELTVYQLLCSLVLSDAEALVALRAAKVAFSSAGAAVC